MSISFGCLILFSILSLFHCRPFFGFRVLGAVIVAVSEMLSWMVSQKIAVWVSLDKSILMGRKWLNIGWVGKRNECDFSGWFTTLACLYQLTVCVHVWVALSEALSVYSLLKLNGVHCACNVTHYWHHKTSEQQRENAIKWGNYYYATITYLFKWQYITFFILNILH